MEIIIIIHAHPERILIMGWKLSVPAPAKKETKIQILKTQILSLSQKRFYLCLFILFAEPYQTQSF